MRFSCQIGHVGYHHEVIEQWVLGLGQHHWHLHLEGSVIGSNGLTRIDILVLRAVSIVATLPVAVVGNPPIGHAAFHLIFYVGSLYRHSCIGMGRSLNGECVAVFVVLLHLGEFHLEGGPFVFLHTERLRLGAHLNGETACEC